MKTWCDNNRLSLIGDGVAVEFSSTPDGDPPSARIDLESLEILGRVTGWEGGLCDLELISAESGDQIMWEHREHVDSQNVGQMLTEFVGKLSLKRKAKE
jgi:hypothetical protein